MDSERLIAMANQIARNLAAQGEQAAVNQTAQHVRDFWDPQMKASILGADSARLDPIAQAAVALLRIDQASRTTR